MTADLIKRYIENNDASVISYKQFNEHKGDMYPTFTFCIAYNPDFIYNDALKELHLSKKEYEKSLEGLVPDSPEKQNVGEIFFKAFLSQLYECLYMLCLILLG